MSTENDNEPIELHMFSSKMSQEIIELLTATAHFHVTGEPLGFGHTVNFGKPWQDESLCDHGLISLPYLDGPALENLDLRDRTIKFYWLIPITKAEMEFKTTFGLEALEERFEQQGFNYVNPKRQSVVI